ncbi:MAG: Toxin and drug export protein A [Verrucomicrobia subdivision 3 bacterium]|nr:Toxin and drug export protein A [Limisphaerales bacterium]MCS1416507.1 Toxin and drug export protein A [Limisphaerales bacterium]
MNVSLQWNRIAGEFFSLLAIALAGCASSPGPKPQNTSVQRLVHELEGEEAVPGGATSEAPFAGLSLSDYLAEAALNNPGLEAAFNRWKAALERIPQAMALPDPRLTYGYFIQHVETRVGPQNHRVGLSQTLPWFGKLRLAGDRAYAAAAAAHAEYEAAKRKLFFNVKDVYFELYYLSQAISITKENIELTKQLEKVAQAKFRSGSDGTGVIRVQVELGKLEDRLLGLEDLRKPLAAKFNATLNRSPEAELPWPTVFELSGDRGAPDELAAVLRSENPELKALSAKVSLEAKGIELAKKAVWPDVSLGVEYVDTGSSRFPGVDGSGRDPLMVSGSINIPLWWGKYRAGVREAEARRNIAVRLKEDRENLLIADLKLVLYEFRDAERKISLFRDVLEPLAENSLEVAEQTYVAGRSDFLQLVDAQQLLLDIQLSYQRAIADREQRLAKIDMLAGSDLWKIGSLKLAK